MMTIRQMRIFTAAARSGSFRACAEDLGLSQVVISTHIRAIEKHLGIALFERRSGLAAELTERGRHAHERMAAILADIDDLGRELAEPRGRRVLRFTTYSFLLLKNEDRLDVFRNGHPNVDLVIDIQPPDTAALANRVQRGDVDCACFFALDASDVPQSRLIGTTELAIYVGSGHPLASVRGVTGEMLCDHPRIALPPSDPQRTLTDRALAAIDGAAPQIAMETDALALMLHTVRRNSAWICMFAETIDDNFPGLRRLDLARPLPPVEVRLLTRPSARHDPALRDLQTCLLPVPEGEGPRRPLETVR